LVVEKDAVFIPAGWDNDKKIAILYENMHRYCTSTILFAIFGIILQI